MSHAPVTPTRPDPTRPDVAKATSPRDREAAEQLVTRYRGTVKARRQAEPPRAVIAKLVDQTEQLLAEGIPPDTVLAALCAWHDRGLGPTVLPSIVHEIQNPRRPRANGRAGPDLDAAMQRAIALEENLT